MGSGLVTMTDILHYHRGVMTCRPNVTASVSRGAVVFEPQSSHNCRSPKKGPGRLSVAAPNTDIQLTSRRTQVRSLLFQKLHQTLTDPGPVPIKDFFLTPINIVMSI